MTHHYIQALLLYLFKLTPDAEFLKWNILNDDLDLQRKKIL